MTWFSVPEGYNCVIRQNDTILYGYVGNQRHTFTLNGLTWQHTSTQTNTTIPNNSVCVTTPQIPSTFLTGALVAAALIVLGAFSIIAKIVKRSYL